MALRAPRWALHVHWPVGSNNSQWARETGGKHRASGLTELLARELRDRGRQVEVEHLHIHLPRVLTTHNETHTLTSVQEPTR